MKKCFWPDCQVPISGDPNPPDADDVIVCNWSDASCWPGNYVPGLDPSSRENITIVIDRHVMLDLPNVYIDDLYIAGTLELDQSAGTDFVIEANNVLVNTGQGGIDNFDEYTERRRRSYNEDNLPEWQFGRFLIGTESTPIACEKNRVSRPRNFYFFFAPRHPL